MIMFALLLAGVFLPSLAAAIALAVVALLLIWLHTLSWPALGRAARIGRVIVVALVLMAALVRLSGLHFVPRR